MTFKFYFHVVYYDGIDFKNKYLKLQNLYNFSDAYFVYQNFPILVSRLTIEWFNDKNNWKSLNTSILKFYAIQNSNSYFQYLEANKFQYQEVYLNVFNNLSTGIIFSSGAGESRAADNNYYQVFGVGKQPVSFITENVPRDVFSDPQVCRVSYPGNQSEIKIKPKENGQPLFPVNENPDNYYHILGGQLEDISFDQIIIYPLGPVDKIIVGDSTQSLFYLQNTEIVKTNNLRVKFFLLKLLRQCGLSNSDRNYKSIQVFPKTTKIDVMFTSSSSINGNENLYYDPDYLVPYTLVQSNELIEKTIDNVKYYTYYFNQEVGGVVISRYRQLNMTPIYGIYIPETNETITSTTNDFLIRGECYILWSTIPIEPVLKIPYSKASFNMISRGISSPVVPNIISNFSKLQIDPEEMANAPIIDVRGKIGERLTVQKGVNFGVVFTDNTSNTAVNYYALNGDSNNLSIHIKNTSDLYRNNLTMNPQMVGDDPLEYGMRYFKSNFDYKRYFQMKNLIKKIVVLPADWSKVQTFDEMEQLYTIRDTEYFINLPLEEYKYCSMHIMSSEFPFIRDLVLYSNCARRIRNRLVPLYGININNCLNSWHPISTIRRFKIYFEGISRVRLTKFKIFLYLS